jgi:hypothetical protein
MQRAIAKVLQLRATSSPSRVGFSIEPETFTLLDFHVIERKAALGALFAGRRCSDFNLIAISKRSERHFESAFRYNSVHSSRCARSSIG